MLLDLLRVAPTATPVSSLIETGALFGFKPSAVRVALTRLLAQGRVESDERGSYRRAPADDPQHTLIESWRLGEARLRPWCGQFFGVLLPKKANRSARVRTKKALDIAGYVELVDAMWVRPNNLSAEAEPSRLRTLGLEADAEHFLVDHFSPERTEQLRRDGWNVKEIRARARKACDALLCSRERLTRLPQKEALVEAFVRGGDAIRVLARDPLLPEPICPGHERRALTEAMLAYDALGRGLWQSLARTRGVPLRLVQQEAC